MKETTTDLIVPDNDFSAGTALHIATQFAAPVIYGSADATAVRRLTWLTGNNEAFAANGKTPLPAARGWYIDKPDEDEPFPDDYELIAAMELLCERNLASECIVVHQDENRKPRRVASWHLPVASLFIVCQGVPSKTEMRDPECRWGVAYSGWQTGVKSSLIFGVFLKELMDAGYNGAFIARFSSYLTDKALACLHAHQYTLKFADALRGQLGDPSGVAYYSYALAIKCSTKTITAKSSKNGQSKELYYPVPMIPRLSARTQEDRDKAMAFLAATAISRDQAFLLEDGGRVERAVEWSVAASKPGDSDATAEGYLDTGGDAGVDMDGNIIEGAKPSTPF